MPVARLLRSTPYDVQDGVLRRDQLRALGITGDEVRAQLAARRWRVCGPLVIVTHNGPLSPQQRQWVTLLSASPDAALCGRTAAAAGGLAGWDDGTIHVLVTKGTRGAIVGGWPVHVHESRRFHPEDPHPAGAPPRTRIERSLVDAAAWSASARTACGLLAAGVQQRLTSVARLRTELDAAGYVRHRAVLRAILADIDGGAQALSEIDFVRFCRRWRLPVPVHQVVRVDGRGRRRYVDAELTAADGASVRVEIDGAAHLLVRSYWDDMDRGNELYIAGDAALRFPSVAYRLEPARVADQIRRALRSPLSRRAPAP